jgi:hypothetical protein
VTWVRKELGLQQPASAAASFLAATYRNVERLE